MMATVLRNQSQRKTGGFNVANLIKIEEKYKCVHCKLLLKDPNQLACGHRICNQCIWREQRDISCPECQEVTMMEQIMGDKGITKDMQNINIDCDLCDWTGAFKFFQEHKEKSHKQHECAYCYQIFNTLESLYEHHITQCPKMTILCKLSEYGCYAKILRCDLAKHYHSVTHQLSVTLCLLKTSAKLMDGKDLAGEFSHQSTDEEETAKKDELDKILNVLHFAIDNSRVQLGRLKQQLEEYTKTNEILEQNQSSIGVSCEESSANLQAYQININLLQQDCLNLKEKIADNQMVAYNGTYIWKITNVRQKMTDAKSEHQTSIYSPPFYSSQTGYKMCARLYFYGDGNARGTHASLFFVLMRGNHDSLLKFPFEYKVTFCLYDQSGHGDHIIDSFRPDTRSSSFQRPKSFMNIASGIPKFVSLSKLDTTNNCYIRDDTMFIRILVDFENIPKSLLKYTFSLNPAIPIHRQHRMTCEENERRALSQSQ